MKKKIKINHLAIIPDGNRRWAKKQGIFDEEKIYQKGADRIKEIVEAIANHDINHLTFWTSSLANLQGRSGHFREIINSFYAKNFNALAENQTIMKKGVKIQVFGEWENNLDQRAIKAIKNAISATTRNEKKILNVLIGYNGKRELGAATIELMNALARGSIIPSQSVEEAEFELRKRAWTGNLPPVDLIIRTGSWEDPHLSADFLIFLVGESQLAFPRIFWPDFSKEELHKIISAYDKRERRFGK